MPIKAQVRLRWCFWVGWWARLGGPSAMDGGRPAGENSGYLPVADIKSKATRTCQPPVDTFAVKGAAVTAILTSID